MIHNKYYEIMKQFLSDYNKQVYGRELVKKVNISQKNIALTLEELEKAGILTSKTRGNTRYFSLNKSNPSHKRYILLSEIERAIEFLEDNPKITHILSKTSKPQIMCIFGSYAAGTHKKGSDLDLFAIGKIDEKQLKQIGKDYNLDINVKKGTKTDLTASLKHRNPLMNEILENHIIISGYEEFVEEVTRQRW